jgi:hypothetical protein
VRRAENRESTISRISSSSSEKIEDTQNLIQRFGCAVHFGHCSQKAQRFQPAITSIPRQKSNRRPAKRHQSMCGAKAISLAVVVLLTLSLAGQPTTTRPTL